MTRLVVVLGSVTPPGRLLKAVQWMAATADEQQPGLSPRLLNLADYRISFADGRPLDQLTDDTPAVVTAISEADAVIFASPVYRASFTGALKNLLDLIPVEGLRGKPCGIVAMGAGQHHYLGVDWQLRSVLAWFGALVAPTSVYIAGSDFTDGELSEAARTDLAALATTVLRLQAGLSGGAPLGPEPLAGRR